MKSVKLSYEKHKFKSFGLIVAKNANDNASVLKKIKFYTR